jgi:hypothetical protein
MGGSRKNIVRATRQSCSVRRAFQKGVSAVSAGAVYWGNGVRVPGEVQGGRPLASDQV